MSTTWAPYAAAPKPVSPCAEGQPRSARRVGWRHGPGGGLRQPGSGREAWQGKDEQLHMRRKGACHSGAQLQHTAAHEVGLVQLDVADQQARNLTANEPV